MPSSGDALSTPKRRWTYDELLVATPESNQPSELWEGELIISPAPTTRHQRAVAYIWQLLNEFVTHRNLGEAFISPLDVVLSPTRAVQPDVIYVLQAKRDIIHDQIRGVPDLVVEVVSEGSWRRDRMDKKALYEQHGLPEYWIVDLEARAIEVFSLVAGAYQLHCRATVNSSATSKLLAGFSLALDQIEPGKQR